MTTEEIIERLKEIRKTVGPRAKGEIQELIDDLSWPSSRPQIVGLGTPSGRPLGAADVEARANALGPRLTESERAMVWPGHRIDAVKAIRHRTGCSLKEAVDAILRDTGVGAS